MKFITLNNLHSARLIKDTIVFPLKVNHDESTILIETMRTDWPKVYEKKRKFFMQYCSTIPSGRAKDANAWHYHKKQEDRTIIVNGAIILVLADSRKKSPTYGVINVFYMKANENPYMILIPKKVLHTILVVSQEKAIILNFPTALYNPGDNITIPFVEGGIFLSKNMCFNWQFIKKHFDLYSKFL